MNTDSIKNIKRFRNLLIITALMIFLLIVVGGIVRVTGSGLGCPDWPKCFGKWIPPMRIDSIIEYTHRLTATLTSPLILASAVIAWRNYRDKPLIFRPLIWAVFFLGIQGLLGGIVVMLETPPNLVAVHFANALVILALTIYPAVVAHHLMAKKSQTPSSNNSGSFSKASLWTTIAIFIVIISGSIVAGSNATESCIGWPLCNGVIFPTNLLGLVHMSHRLLVAIVSVWMVVLFQRIRRGELIPTNMVPTTKILIVLFFSQALIGAIKVTTSFPILMLGLHVVIAAAIWAATVVMFTLSRLNNSIE